MAVVSLVPKSRPERATHTTVDTVLLTPELVASWRVPPFQRPLRPNAKLMSIVERLKSDGGVLPGVVTLGALGKDVYVVDGQHRLHAFILSELREGFADVRTCHYENMAQMADEFVHLNSKIVAMRPDDVLRGLEGSYPALKMIREGAPFVGYDVVRRRDGTSPLLLSMSATLRYWHNSNMECPGRSVPFGAAGLAERLSTVDAGKLVKALNVIHKAWGADDEYRALWGGLNMTLTLWFWVQSVINKPYRGGLTAEQFATGIQALSASADYMQWLRGRVLSNENRAPALRRIKTLMARRLGAGTKLVEPDWGTGRESRINVLKNL